MNVLRLIALALGRFAARVMSGAMVAIVVVIVLAAIIAKANYNATTGGATTFASVVAAGAHLAGMVVCDPSAGAATGTCAAVKPASQAAGALDPSFTTTLSPNSVGTKITDGSNTAVVKGASTSPLGTDTALVTSLSPNSAGLLPTGQATMANSAPVAIASNQTAIPVTVSNANANGAATSANSSPVVIASDQAAVPTSVSQNNANVVPKMCSKFVRAAISSNTDTQLVNVDGTKTIYICDYKFYLNGVGSFYLEKATTGTCATLTQIDIQWTGSATTPIGKGAGNPWYQGLNTGASAQLCVHTAALSSTSVEIGVFYDQY